MAVGTPEQKSEAMPAGGRAVAAAALVLLSCAWTVWGRTSATAASFLLSGLILAIALSGTLVARILVAVGALVVAPAARRGLTLALVASALLTVAHFSALALRRHDFEARLTEARAAVSAVEAVRSRTGALPESLDGLGLPFASASRMSLEPMSDGTYLLCFRSAGDQRSCYRSRTRQWEIAP